MKKLILIVLLSITVQFLFAQEIKIDAYVDKSKIGIQDYLKLTIEISGENANDVKTPILPEIKNLKNLGSSSSSSSSFTVINGKMTSEVIKNYTYTLQPQKTGNFIIPPISITYKKQVITTDPIYIKVIEGSTEPAPPTSGKLGSNRKQSSSDLSENLFVITKVDKKNIFKEEPVTVNYILYTRYEVVNLSFGSEPNFKGFWKEDVFIPENINFSTEKYNGMIYNAMLMRTITLFPTTSGKLAIPPLELQVDIRTQSHSFFDFGSSKRYPIKSKPVNINVKELPEENKPMNFCGAVGKFKISSSINKTELKVGDSFTYTLKISGSGNLKQFDIPTLPDIQHLRFLDPEISTKINKNKISGTKSIKYLVIAQEKGAFSIPSIDFTYFDTSEKRYVTKSSRSYELDIQEGDGIYIPSSTAQSMVIMEGSDIGFIIKKTDLNNNLIYFNSFGYWFIWLIVSLLIPISLIYSSEQRKLAGNIDYLRQKKANKILKKYLKQASLNVNESNLEFYTAAQLGLGSFLADKLKIARGSTTEQLLFEIEKRKFPDSVVQKIKELFEKCNQARFMPGGFSKENINNDFKLLRNIVTDILKLKI